MPTRGAKRSLYTLYALKVLHLTPGVLGLVIGCGGIGALAGAAVAPVLVRRFDRFDGRRVLIAALPLLIAGRDRRQSR